MVKAYVLIINESGTEDSVISNLKNIPSITDAFGTFGTWDILTKLVSSNEENIQHDISKGIRKISNIRSTLTLIVDEKLGFLKTNEIEQKILDNYMAKAFITIHCSKSDEYSVIKNLEEIPEVVEVNVLVGHNKLICKIMSPTYNDISEIVSKKVRKIQGIKSTNTINVINNQGFSRK
ncbi:Lrp/AsnC ligand binding domain-containing protein [Marine Group I thaumarchaeote]|uniref:Lrp/AsnC ligand binding domain-containing protein n=1 Tax=Marine Group I thaumarchaeote TaxID=2511932 RepID=A0A7K4MHT1_9ARCH|nr:MAG: Lrp/AsnC family transcriptional regulator [Nitrosopumilus sp. YT1]NMI82640.1 Lrp/AsnC family transcriptional regulator [Candidatus Nitrosopumilus sp. MTA1]NWJ20590.1 Lrp/AsnC ligand binding domain-containing protein [Marine Group I thaumarchaeote]NWJ28744.1 Lrp/AsnC ligand binding domain-containing protein [Marine Group I thaumarchaeote]NWJ57266.1 Lrp/AsnC ligand binding domain-containing protein [Marine Group I thaumarchaeote]